MKHPISKATEKPQQTCSDLIRQVQKQTLQKALTGKTRLLECSGLKSHCQASECTWITWDVYVGCALQPKRHSEVPGPDWRSPYIALQCLGLKSLSARWS
mmetsp:Transcript_76952/g.169930  ORF Transcript_76952/g.169930 Transcript_76952/m.169930 type:complete len:100 (-) Transcript_76952:1333-1632(-)